MQTKYFPNHIALYLIIPFSGFYITKLPLSPIYLLVIAGSYLIMLDLFLRQKIKFDKISLLVMIFLNYLLISQLFLFTPNISAFINFIFSLIVFLVIYSVMHRVDSNYIINLAEKLIYFSIPLLIYEAYYRITHPVFFVDFAAKGREDLVFYYYKINSVMYLDSNFVGIYILTLFFFLLYINQFTQKNYFFTFMLLFFLILATISRSSIFSLLLFLVLYQFRRFIYKHKKIVFILAVSLIVFLIPILVNDRTMDDSFSTKFTIFERTFSYYLNTSIIHQLFGVGFGNAEEVLDMGAHNFFVTYFVESGLIGLIFVLTIWIYILLKTKYKAGIVMFPFLLNGMSLASGAIPYLYVMFAVILTLESRRKKIAK